MTGETKKEFVDPFEGDTEYWERTNLSPKARAALDDPRLAMGALQRETTTSSPFVFRASDAAALAAANRAEGGDRAVAAAQAEVAEPPADPTSETGVPARPLLADVMGPEPAPHPQPE